jgi:hypothetical protein
VGVADIDGTQQSREVAPDSGTPADGVGVGTHDPRLDRVSGRPAVGEGQTLDESRLNRLRHAPHQIARARDPQQIALRARGGGRRAIARRRRRCRWRRSRRRRARAPRAGRPLPGRGREARGRCPPSRGSSALRAEGRARCSGALLQAWARHLARGRRSPRRRGRKRPASHGRARDTRSSPPGRATDRRSPSAALMDTTASRWRAPCFVDGG